MTFVRSLFDPRRIAGQIAILIVLAVAVVHAIFFGMLLLRAPRDPAQGRPLQDRFAAILRLVDGAPDAQSRVATLAAARAAFPGFALTLDSGAAGQPDRSAPQAILDRIRQSSGIGSLEAVADDAATGPSRTARLVATLSDGSRLKGQLDLHGDVRPEFSFILLGALIFIAVTVALLSLWAARALTFPLTSFAAAAEDFSLDAASPPLREGGPSEIRVATRALNRMHARIRRLVDDRTRMLAAVSHDLRTPITRLRLRAELMKDEAVSGPMLRDLDQMNAMISGALSFLRDGQSGTTVARVDLSALLATIADDFSETGRQVTFEGPDRLIVPGRTDELLRAVTNLVENAVKHADTATIRLRGFAGVAEIDVEDSGPGIAPTLRETLTQPFARGDSARNLDGSAGFGLGLSIVRSVAEAHGGRLMLLDAQPRGLLARITLPQTPGAHAEPA